MAFSLSNIIKNNYRTVFAVLVVITCFYFSLEHSYILFHTIVELFSIIIASAVFIVTWNSRKMMDNRYLYFVGIAYFFIAALDLLHTLTYDGMGIIGNKAFYANQFWIATRSIESLAFIIGFYFLRTGKKPSAELVFLGFFIISVIVTLSIMVWHIFPICYIKGVGQTDFKIYAEYVIILVLMFAGYLLYVNRNKFSLNVYRLLLCSIAFTIASEVCFSLYISNSSLVNEYGHYFKLIAFFLVYKAIVETGFIKPTAVIFKGLTDNEQKYRTLAENLPGAIMRFDRNFNLIYANSSGQKLMINSVDVTLLNPDLYVSIIDALEQAKKNGKTIINETNFSIASSNYYYLLQTIPEINVQNGELILLMICSDISRQKHAEQELRGLNATKDKLFSVIAHDLKTPFTSLISFSELMQRNASKLSPEKVSDMASRINSSAKQAYVLLDNLLSWSRVQTGLLVPKFSGVYSTELLNDALELASPIAQIKGITLTMDTNEGSFLETDAQMVATVLRNLVSNAIKFSHAGSEIILGAIQKNTEVVFWVADKGVGISEENAKNLLGIENKVSLAGTANEKGTGLGLILCREFVELCGGKIWFESKLGEGTTFSFSLPL